jgi:hypothetical protein
MIDSVPRPTSDAGDRALVDDQARPTIRSTASRLRVSAGVVQRLISVGLLSLPLDAREIEKLAWRKAPVMPIGWTALVVSLGAARSFTADQRGIDGNWRNGCGFFTTMTPVEVILSASGWWRTAGVPNRLVAVVAGGFEVGSWKIAGVDATLPGGFKRFSLLPDAQTTAVFGGTRVHTSPGSTSRLMSHTIP